MDYRQILEEAYFEAANGLPNESISLDNPSLDAAIDVVVQNIENSKAVFTVLITSLTQKIVDPKQDVRKHQKQIPGGYSGRHIDTKYITPFLKDINFPSMGESGWLTRSLEQPHPYDSEYPGKIRGEGVKEAFLQVMSAIEVENVQPKKILINLFAKSYVLVESNRVLITRSDLNNSSLRRETLVDAFSQHFRANYGSTHGAARLPVLAIYACLKTLVSEESLGRTLKPRILGSHTSPDFRSGALGDIELEDSDGAIRTAIEVKHDVKITHELVRTSGNKVKGHALEQLHIVSTGSIVQDDVDSIQSYKIGLFKDYGCDLLVFDTGDYLLSLLSQVLHPESILETYAGLLETDPVVQKIHKVTWNQILVKNT